MKTEEGRNQEPAVLPSSSFIVLAVYDLLGREVARLVNGVQPAGTHAVNFDGSGLASGVYIYRLVAGSNTLSRTMLLLK